MKLQLIVITVIFLLPSIRCRETIGIATTRFGLHSSQLEPGFNCAGGIAGILTKYLGQRKVAPEKVSLTILGICVFNPDFNQRFAGDISRIPLTIISLSNGQLDPTDARIFVYTVLYYCQDNLQWVVYQNNIKYVDDLLLIKPYVLFTISKHVRTELTKYASVQSCRISHDHRLVDKFYFFKIRQNWLIPQINMTLNGDLCDIYPGSLQVPSTMSIHMKIKVGNCTNFMGGQREPYFRVSSTDLRYSHEVYLKYSSILREFYYLFDTDCIKPLAIVEPSEWALVKPLSGSFAGVLFGTILAVCLLSSMGSLEECKILFYQIISSIVTPQEVVVPHLNGMFKFQRLLLMGLFIVLFQSVIVNNFKTEVTTELLEPERDLTIFKMRGMSLMTLPYRSPSSLLKAITYKCFLTKNVFCLIHADDVRDGLGIPVVRVDKNVVTYAIGNRYVRGNALRISKMLSSIREHELIPMTLRYIHNYTTADLSDDRSIIESKSFHRRALPTSRWSPEKHWEALKEFFETCIGTMACGFDGGTQKVLMKDSDLSPVFRMKHLRETIRLCSVLFFISVIVFIGELICKYVYSVKRENKVSPNSRVN